MTLPQQDPHPISARDVFDVLTRFVLGTVFAFTAGTCIRKGILEAQSFNFADLHAYQLGKLLSIFAIGLYTMMIACLFAIRRRPINRAMGVWPAVAAILGGFLTSALLWLGPNEALPLWARALASFMVLIGTILATLIILRLGKSFSILPESRRLVTTGPYALVRHPLYLAEAVVTLGVMINFLSVWAVLVVAAQFALQITRMHYEEKTLRETFPEYDDYARKTPRLLPGIY